MQPDRCTDCTGLDKLTDEKGIVHADTDELVS